MNVRIVKVHHYDAFTKEPNKGNPAGIVLNGDEFDDQEMQHIAFKIGFNETAFLVKSKVADIQIRFFSPEQEMNLCGHATMAMIYALKTKGLLEDKTEITIETKAGILPIKIQSSNYDEIVITMKQATPQFKEFKGSIKDLAYSIGVKETDINDELPILYGSTGAWTLLIPIKQIKTFNDMKPRNEDFPKILNEIPTASVHPFCLEAYDSNAHMHARHFSSPYSGTVEDPVTGTASGVMGAYFAKYIKDNNFEQPLNLIVEQGNEMNKDGRVRVGVTKINDRLDVEITGNVTYVKDMEMELENRII